MLGYILSGWVLIGILAYIIAVSLEIAEIMGNDDQTHYSKQHMLNTVRSGRSVLIYMILLGPISWLVLIGTIMKTEETEK